MQKKSKNAAYAEKKLTCWRFMLTENQFILALFAESE